jgi:Skp family chaperone for outer membrane proteins
MASFDSFNQYGRWTNRLRLVCAVAIAFLGVLPASAQQPEDLQLQLQQLKREYEQTTQQLQTQIAALEQQIEAEKENREKRQATISPSELAQEAAKVLGESDQVSAKYQGVTLRLGHGKGFGDADCR